MSCDHITCTEIDYDGYMHLSKGDGSSVLPDDSDFAFCPTCGEALSDEAACERINREHKQATGRGA